MIERLFAPIPVAYQGLYADEHLVDAQQFGMSLIGISKVANSICHEFFFEKITHDTRSFQIRFCVGPSRENGLLQEIVAVLNSGLLPVFTPVLLKAGKQFVELTFDAIVKRVLNRKSETSQAIDALHDLTTQYADFAKHVHKGQMQDKKFLQAMIEGLVRENRAALREIPDPVGKTVRLMRIGDVKRGPIIDEPVAEVLRAHDFLELGDLVEYDVQIEGVFKTDGACRLRLLDDNRIVPGKITDPVLKRRKNVYTKALNEAAILHVVAQPTLKNGTIHRLFITHATIVRRKPSTRKKQSAA